MSTLENLSRIAIAPAPKASPLAEAVFKYNRQFPAHTILLPIDAEVLLDIIRITRLSGHAELALELATAANSAQLIHGTHLQ